MTAVAVLAAAALVVVAWGPVRPRSRPAPTGLPGLPGQRRRCSAWRVRRRRRPPDLAVVVTEVASRLRTGAPPGTAWALTVERVLGPAAPGDRAGRSDGARGRWPAGDGPGAGGPDRAAGEPRGLDRPGAGRPDGADGVPAALTRLVQHCSTDPAAAGAARTILAATRLTQHLGAPLAEVLERCASTVTEAEQARDARRVALAGPRSTARILAGLPLLGLLLGTGLGADPVAAATDRGWGTVSVVAGLALLVAGRRWTRALVAAAERPSTARPRRWRVGR